MLSVSTFVGRARVYSCRTPLCCSSTVRIAFYLHVAPTSGAGSKALYTLRSANKPARRETSGFTACKQPLIVQNTIAALRLQQRDMYPNTIGPTEGCAYAEAGKRLADLQAGITIPVTHWRQDMDENDDGNLLSGQKTRFTEGKEWGRSRKRRSSVVHGGLRPSPHADER